MGKMTMFVDPGLGGTGAAIFSDLATGRVQQPIWYDRLITPKESGTWLDRSIQIATWIQMIIQEQRNQGRAKWEGLFVEFPEVWSGSLKSNTAVRGGKNGSAPLLKLASLSGMIVYSFLMGMRTISSPRVCVQYLKPADWKGQLDKKQVIRRIHAAYFQDLERVVLRDHEADAVGMGLAYQKGGKV